MSETIVKFCAVLKDQIFKTILASTSYRHRLMRKLKSDLDKLH